MSDNTQKFGTQPNENYAINVVDNPGMSHHMLTIPVADFCPITNNPEFDSSVHVGYFPEKKLLELYSLSAFVSAFKDKGEAMDLEKLVFEIGKACAIVLQSPVYASGDFSVDLNGRNIHVHCSVNLNADGNVMLEAADGLVGVASNTVEKAP